MSYISEVLPSLLDGALITLQVFFIVILFSIPLGAILAFLMQVPFRPLRWLLNLYVWIMRGTPLLLQLIFIYYVLPSAGITFDRMPAAILAFTLNYAAYFAEIYRSGIQSMPVGQYEAAQILGYSRFQTFFKIILPQVIKRILPSVTNEVITLVKDTSLAFTLSVAEMFSIAKGLAASQTNMIPFVAAGLFYYIFNLVVAVGMEWAEKKLNYYQ